MAKTQTKVTKDFLDEFQNLLTETKSSDLLGRIIEIGLKSIMEMERDAHIGVDSYERSEDRTTYRNGYKPRQLNTRVGCLNLAIPQTRDGQFYPSILERYQRSEKALVLALAEAYFQGVSTRKMKQITEELLGRDFSSGTISRFAGQLDAELDAWRNRSFTEDYPYVIIDARYDKCRIGSKITDIAVLTALGIDQHGFRRFLSIETAWGETNTSWDHFLEGLKDRGLKGVRLFTSDHHSGIRNAIKKHYPGTPWQRCQRHFLVNAMDWVPNRYRDQVHDQLIEVWASHNFEQAQQRLNEMAESWADPFLGFSTFLSEQGLETLTVFTITPKDHWKKIRTSNMIERTNQEFKRRGRVVRIFPNPESCVRLYGAIAKEWDEDWVSGKKYLDMAPLWEWEKEIASKAAEHAPLPSKIPQKVKELNVA